MWFASKHMQSLHRGRGCYGGAISFSLHPSIFQYSLYLLSPVYITHCPSPIPSQSRVINPPNLTPPPPLCPWLGHPRLLSPKLPTQLPLRPAHLPSRRIPTHRPAPTLPPPWVCVEARGRVGGLRLLGRRCWGGMRGEEVNGYKARGINGRCKPPCFES